MRIRVRSNFSATKAKLSRAKTAVRMTFAGEMKGAARLVAVSLAHETAPFGDKKEDRIAGEIATARDIRRVYATPGQVYEAFTTRRLANAFYARLKNGEIAHAQKLIDQHCPKYRGVPIGEFDLTIHQGRRNKRGRISKTQRALQIVRNPKALFSYIKAEVKLVGWGKAGWAQCARLLAVSPGTRGIPQWVTRHVAAPGRVADGTKSTDKPFIVLTNLVSYASQILTPASKLEAVRIGLDRYFANQRVTQVVRYALRRALQ